MFVQHAIKPAENEKNYLSLNPLLPFSVTPDRKMADEELFDLLHTEIVAQFTDSSSQTEKVCTEQNLTQFGSCLTRQKRPSNCPADTDLDLVRVC